MKRYFVLRDIETREVYVTLPLDEAPENSIEVVPGECRDCIRPVFDQYPNPTAIVEGATDQEIDATKSDKIALLDLEYTEAIDNVMRVPMQKERRTGLPIPQSVFDQCDLLLAEYHQKVFEITGVMPLAKAAANTKLR